MGERNHTDALEVSQTLKKLYVSNMIQSVLRVKHFTLSQASDFSDGNLKALSEPAPGSGPVFLNQSWSEPLCHSFYY